MTINYRKDHFPAPRNAKLARQATITKYSVPTYSPIHANAQYQSSCSLVYRQRKTRVYGTAPSVVGRYAKRKKKRLQIFNVFVLANKIGILSQGQNAYIVRDW